MKNFKTYIRCALFSLVCTSFGYAQVKEMPEKARTLRTDTVAQETTEKTYKLYEEGKLIKNTVRINSVQTQKIQFEGDDQGKIDQDRVIPKKTIYKTVKIDHDEDDAFDEMIRFSYNADVKSNFVLLLNENELYVALGEGENLKITENTDLSHDALNKGKEVFVFTDSNGNEISFKVEGYQIM
jgi:hypothetical protein